MSHSIIRLGTALLLLAGITLSLPAAAADSTSRNDSRPHVRLETTAGPIDIELFPERAPQTVANFIDLVETGFYDGLIFHRVVANFVIQAGGYDANMTYKQPPRQVPSESANGLQNLTGTLAMARLDDPDSADTQFFINVNDNRHLDRAPGKPGYTVFGRVVDGMDTVLEIELGDTGIVAGMASVPTEPVIIRRAILMPAP